MQLESETLTKTVVTVRPIDHVCMYGHCNNMAVPEKTVRAGSTHYHYCELHP